MLRIIARVKGKIKSDKQKIIAIKPATIKPINGKYRTAFFNEFCELEKKGTGILVKKRIAERKTFISLIIILFFV
jgi:hypothetical protein